MMEPAIDAAPLAMVANSSARVRRRTAGRMPIGSSLWPSSVVSTAANAVIGETPSRTVTARPIAVAITGITRR